MADTGLQRPEWRAKTDVQSRPLPRSAWATSAGPSPGALGTSVLASPEGSDLCPSLSWPPARLSSRSTLLRGWVGVPLRARGSLFLTSELRDFPMLQGNQGYRKVAAPLPEGPHPSSRHPPQPGWGASHFTWESPVGRGEESQKCLLPCSVGCKQSSDQGPLARPSLLTPKIPEASPTLPSGIHSLSFPLPNYNVGGAGTQPGPQIPAPGGALEYRLLPVTGTPFGAGFLGGSPHARF